MSRLYQAGFALLIGSILWAGCGDEGASDPPRRPMVDLINEVCAPHKPVALTHMVGYKGTGYGVWVVCDGGTPRVRELLYEG